MRQVATPIGLAEACLSVDIGKVDISLGAKVMEIAG